MSTSIPATLATCFLAAAEKYDLPVGLLEAVGFVESSYNAQAISYDTNGTYSVGVMQINSSWLDDLAKFGIDETHLWMPCTNIEVGAWILAQEVARYGYSWEAIGAYNAGPYKAQNREHKLDRYRWYAGKVLSRWRRAEQLRPSATATGRAGNNAD